MNAMRTRKLPAGMWNREGTYYARFRANGREVRKRLSTDFKTACLMLNELRSRADKADFNLLDNDYSYVELKDEFLKWVRQTKRRPKEYERHFKTIETYGAISSVRQLDSTFVVGFRDWRIGNGLSPRTVNIEVGTLVNMLNRGVDWGRIGSNPVVGIDPLPHDSPKKKRRALSAAEVRSLFDASREHFKPVWRMYMQTGIRRTELVSLKFSDIKWECGVISIRAEHSKNRKAREIPLNDDMLAMLRGLMEQAKHRQPVAGPTEKITRQQAARFSREHVFVSKANTPLRNNLLTRFYETCQRAGIKDGKRGGSVDIHSLRVSFTTLAIDSGASPKAVQEILGHSSLDLTMRVYAKATETAKRAAVSGLPF